MHTSNIEIDVTLERDLPRLQWKAKEEWQGQAEELDGIDLLRTDRLDLTAERIWKIYVMPTHVFAT